jgi:citrate lyase synthetase
MVGVILFRAQPFHRGHLKMVQKAYKDCAENKHDLYIFVGSANASGTTRNPLPFGVRMDLIEGSLKEVFQKQELEHIHIFPLADLTNETDNSYDWGRYLFVKMLSKTHDVDMTIYYSDNPQIMLSWFDKDERWCLRFKFLDRYENISATQVRLAFSDFEHNQEILYNLLPNYVFQNRELIYHYLQDVKGD